MSPLVTKLLIQIVMKFGAPIAWSLVKGLFTNLRHQYDSATPEQRAEWDKDWAADFKTDESGGTGPGIVLKDAFDPDRYIDSDTREND